jgi:error-prone DNA polymerase
MQMAVDVAGFTPAEADQLRRAMGSKRSSERMEKLKQRMYEGMAERGITGEVADGIYEKLLAFANFGFPESHSVSFALLVYASAWIKYYYPAAFCAALLNAQPMGFYSAQSLVADARRHAVEVHGPDVNASDATARLEGEQDHPAVRLGLGSVRTIGGEVAERIEKERAEHGPYVDMADVARRVGLTVPQAEALATAGAFDCFGASRREALWAAGAIAQERPDRIAGVAVGVEAPMLPGMSEVEEAMADVWATGVSPGSYPTQYARGDLTARGVVTVAGLAGVEPGRRVLIGGVVTHRQRPATAGGVTFLNIEDETGMVNVVCSPGVWARHRRVARSSAAMLIRGRLERSEGVTNIVAERMAHLVLNVATTSRDFR